MRREGGNLKEEDGEGKLGHWTGEGGEEKRRGRRTGDENRGNRTIGQV